MGGKNSYESIKRYQDKAYDKILVRLPKGQKDTLQAHAQAQGQSVNAFINGAIDAEMGKSSERPVKAPTTHDGTGMVSLHPEAYETAQEAAQRAGETVPQFVKRAVTTQARRDEVARKTEGGK